MQQHNAAQRQSQPGEAERIVQALGGSGNMAPCPAHDDGKPSLSVTERNGAVLVHCHAGCSQDAVIAALKDKGLWPTNSPRKPAVPDDREDEWHPEHQKFKRGFRILLAAAACKQSPRDYLQNRGIEDVPENLMLMDRQTTKRMLGKSFPAMVAPVTRRGELVGAHVTFLNKDGGSKLQSNDAVKKMFGLVKGGYVQLGEIDPEKPLKSLVVAEGIETALAVRRITGLPAVAALSASNMQNVQLPKAREIIIAADNDKPGIEAANKLAEQIFNQGFKRVRIATPEHEDSDWNDVLQSGANLEALRDAILEAPRSEDHGIYALTTEEMINLPVPSKQYILHPWLPLKGLTMIHGQRGNGKTWLALSVAYAAATGKELLGWAVEKPWRVLYIDGEMGKNYLQERISQLGPVSNDLLWLIPEQYHSRDKSMPDLASVEGQEEIDRIVIQQKIDLVIVDNLSALIRTGEENAAESWMPIQSWALRHKGAGRSVIFIAHEGAHGGRPRGTSKREDLLDSTIGIKSQLDLAEGSESVFELKFTKHRGFHGEDAAMRIIRLTTESGTAEWSSDLVKSKADRVKELKVKGYNQKQIGKELGMSQSAVSRLLNT